MRLFLLDIVIIIETNNGVKIPSLCFLRVARKLCCFYSYLENVIGSCSDQRQQIVKSMNNWLFDNISFSHGSAGGIACFILFPASLCYHMVNATPPCTKLVGVWGVQNSQ